MEQNGSKFNETRLFFGDSVSVLNQIISNGFDTSFAREGQLGRGFYFYSNASSCLLSSDLDKNEKIRSIIYSNVALGEVTEIDKNLISLMSQNNFVSLLKNRDTIKLTIDKSYIFMINENARAYPNYLITIKSTLE